jgi:hypothetical protein
MTIQLPRSAQLGAGPTGSTTPDDVEPAALVASDLGASDLVAVGLAAGPTKVRALPTPLALLESSATSLTRAAPVSENPRERPGENPVVVEIGNRPGLSEAAFQPGTGPRWNHH